MLGIGKEVGIFIQAGLAGLIVVLVYVCIRIVRRLIKHTQIAINIEDLLYWCGTAIYLFVQIYHTSDGRVRWFFILGIAIGTLFSLVLLLFLKKVHKKFYGKKGAAEEKRC